MGLIHELYNATSHLIRERAQYEGCTTAVYIPCHVKEEIMAGEKQVIGVHELKTCQWVLEYLLRPLPGAQTHSV